MTLPGFSSDSVAYALLVLSGVAAAGLAFGSVSLRGVKLGVAGVLFAGLLAGRGGLAPDAHFLEFLRELGLVLFVYTVGLQLGPGFISAFRKDGLKLNLLAAGVVTCGFAIAAAAALWLGVDPAAAVGLFSGATTNTPSLAASQEVMRAAGATERTLGAATAGYAVAYPFGVVGIIVVMLASRAGFRVDVKREAAEYEMAEGQVEQLGVMNLRVTNPNLFGLAIERIPALAGGGVVSRVRSQGKVSVARPETILHEGDVLLVVGTEQGLEQLRLIIGEKVAADLREQASGLASRRLVVTHGRALGKSLHELSLAARYGTTITRVIRADVELAALPSLRVQYGDVLVAVGESSAIEEAAKEFGNSAKALKHPQLVPLFLGIGAGIVLGSVPISVPGLPVPVRLGYAGGPLLAAIVLANVGRIGRLVWYLPTSANYALREIGIVMFLAAVGLRSGERFFDAITTGEGLTWMAVGAAVTLIPLALAAFAAQAVLRLNYLTSCGLLAGSMTDPPALAFVDSLSSCRAAAVSYAAVYPLTMILRIVLAQVLAGLLFL